MAALNTILGIHAVSTSPAPPPARASKVLSVSNWRITRPRLAPSESRRPISFCRLTARARSRLAKFAQTINNTRLTAPMSNAITGTTFPRVLGLMYEAGDMTTLKPWLVAGYSNSRRRDRTVISACACSRVTPDFKRPATASQWPCRSSGR